MLRLVATLHLIALVSWTTAEAQSLVVSRGGTHLVRQGPADNFTGNARVETLFDARDPSHASGGSVSFDAGARTAWHPHPRGQILIITAGVGRVQRWGAAFEEVRTGDVVRIPADTKHWHGASPHTAVTHIAISEHLDGRRRTELSPRDRSLVTIATLIATGKTAQLLGHQGRALDAGVRQIEASGLLAHLAIYSGWPNAVSALEIYEQVYSFYAGWPKATKALGATVRILGQSTEPGR